MEIAWLEDFMALAECGHFSRAAEKRNITQPAFSRRVKTLEDWVGAPLFDRDTIRIELTVAGQHFKPVAEEVLRLVYLGREQARNAAQASAETLHFASTHALSMTFFPDWLRRIEEQTPFGSTVSLVTDNMAGCERLMLKGEMQFLLCHHHPSASTALDPKHFRSVDLGEDLLIPVSVPRSVGSALPLHELPGTMQNPVSYLAYSATSGMGRIIAATRALDAPPAWLRPAFTSHVATVLVAMARNGRGAAWLPLSLIETYMGKGELVRAGDQQWDIPIQIRLVRPRVRQSSAAEKFWTFIQRLAERRAQEQEVDHPT